MNSKIGKWGNSPALRLPMHVIREAEFSLQEQVSISATPGRIVIEPAQKFDFDIRKLSEQIDQSNSHAEISFGQPVGSEIF